MKATFDRSGDFAAMTDAEGWCKFRGISIGRMQRGDPRGLMRGHFEIAKWRNLYEHERLALDGTMTGDMRNGPVTVTLDSSEKDWPVLTTTEVTA
jgi:hypothetical protein